MAIASSALPDLHLVGAAAGALIYARYRYTADGTKIDNITDWGFKQFEKQYGKDKARPITKDAIFHYVYGVLHDPVYRETYAQNLKRDFPRIPFYPDFWQWAEWGEKLMDLHINYEDVEPWVLKSIDRPENWDGKQAPKPILRADKDNHVILIDEDTILSEVPPSAWHYKLGNRSAIEWVLDQYKEKKPKDPTIREKFNTYRFADYKDHVIELLGKVVKVSVETVAIQEAMKRASR